MSKVFYTKFSELSGNRFDASYYIPELVELEKKVTNISTKRLKDFVVSISSGATPKKSANNDYYEEDKNKGTPFLRVQNLTAFGKLDFKGLKYITPETHHKMLKRSQVVEDDLLIKITGVGRMAIASVPDKGFIGNTNQHMVVVKTKSREVSETLATYLNLDIAEKLASRRATGGTRPALDYPALLSIPVIYDEKIVQKMNDAYQQKQQKEQEAKEKLESIDDYLLDALGIKLPEKQDESVEDRVFFRKFSEVSGRRQDVYYHKQSFILSLEKIKKAKYEVLTLGKIIKDLKNGIEVRNYIENGGIRYLRVTDLGKNGLSNRSPKFVATQEIPKRIQLNSNCILISRSGSLGLVNIVEESIENAILSSHIFKVELKSNILPLYAEAYLRSIAGQIEIFRNNNGGVIPEINQTALKSILIVLPPMQKQLEIVNHIQQLRDEAKSLKEEASRLYNEAKEEVEKMILGEEV